jgi:hypothetical protein
MPRYFFHVSRHDSRPDNDGSYLPDIHAAKAAALRLCGELIQEIDESFWTGPQWELRVTNDQQTLLFTLSFSGEDAADVRLASPPH